jgi:branched-chain amino acid transport system substrate-binding protein
MEFMTANSVDPSKCTRPFLGQRPLGALTLAAVLLLIGCGRNDSTYRVGLLVPLTGGAASYGQNARRGAELAVQHFAKTNPSIHVELKIEDSKGESATGTKAAAKLVDLDRVVAVVGCVTSGVTLAAAPLMNEKRIPLISPGGSSPKITEAGEYVFRTWPSDDFEAKRMAEYLSKRGVKSLAILRANNEYGQALESSMRSNLTALGGTVRVVATETFEQGAREMRTQLLRIGQAHPDAIYFVGFPEAAVVFGRGYREAELKIPVYATSAFEDPQVASAVGDALDGTVYGKPSGQSPAAEKFGVDYYAAYKTEPGVVADTTYDAVMLVLDAIRQENKDGTPITGNAIHDLLLRVKDYPGASGILTFDRNGDVIKPIALYALRNKRYEELAQ